MAVRKRMTKAVLRKRFTHYGLFWGCVPVYVNMRNPECPDVATRNWVPDWTMDAVESVANFFIALRARKNPGYMSLTGIALTGLIEDSE